ncbi:MAG: NADH-quinone oxidoreductase subunit A [Ignavibacteriales bacterium]|nr:NADH-quinone oxidoreductase subunit A [Ignavibacteriales bacterium]
MLTEFGNVFIFLIIGAMFVAGGLIASWILRPNRPYPEKLASYECGEEPVGDAWVKFNVRFYVVALIFLIFDVEVVFLFPWALVYRQLGLFAFLEMAVFLVILLVGFAYVWVKGDLDWDKPKPEVPKVERRPSATRVVAQTNLENVPA